MRALASALSLRSGCHCEARRRQARLTSDCEAPGLRPSSAYACSALIITIVVFVHLLLLGLLPLPPLLLRPGGHGSRAGRADVAAHQSITPDLRQAAAQGPPVQGVWGTVGRSDVADAVAKVAQAATAGCESGAAGRLGMMWRSARSTYSSFSPTGAT